MRRRYVHILGAGGHGRDIGDIVNALGWDGTFHDDHHLARFAPTRLQNEDDPYVVGVNDPATRRRLAVGTNPVTLVHPSATVAPTARLSPGCVVGAGAHIGPDTILGTHVHVGPGCTITRTEVGAFTTISPGVDIAGDCTIGEGVMVGVGAVVANLRSIGDGAVIGAGAVVVRDVSPGETVVCRDLTATGVQR